MEEIKNDEQIKMDQESSSETCQQELEQIKGRYLYLHAEFDNYKRRVEKDRLNWMETAQDLVLLDILSIHDDIERALNQLKSMTLAPDVTSHLTGFELIEKEISKVLKKYDIEEIPFSKVFDPEKHDAIMQVPSQEALQGEVVSVLQKGYLRRGRVLRPSKVSVAQ